MSDNATINSTIQLTQLSTDWTAFYDAIWTTNVATFSTVITAHSKTKRTTIWTAKYATVRPTIWTANNATINSTNRSAIIIAQRSAIWSAKYAAIQSSIVSTERWAHTFTIVATVYASN